MHSQIISKAARQDIWEEQTKNGAPGPGNYAENTSSFAHIKGGAANMGSKHRQDSNFNPGPGQYESALGDMSNRQAVNVRIGNEKARNDLFGVEKAADQPGPGAYQSPDRKVKGFVMTGK